MKILTVDIGTGTQDIFLLDTRYSLENGYKLVLPSPTLMVSKQLQQAAKNKRDILLTGVTMGGGPSGWAVSDHIHAGLRVFATLEAAKTFDDDPEMIEQMGISLVSHDEASALDARCESIELRDFNFQMIAATFASYGVDFSDLAAVAVAVFDHGEAPPGISDRKFRFDYLDQRIRQENRLSAFAYPSENIPVTMTRMQAVAQCARELAVPLVVMDTAPAAILGSSFDPFISSRSRNLIINLGNMHALAFRLGPEGIEGVFEHHTSLLDASKFESLIKSFAAGNLTNQDVFEHHGHGALIYSSEPYPLNNSASRIVVTGPRRNILANSRLNPYFAVPFGDMMLTGCFGLLSATADQLPTLGEEIRSALSNNALKHKNTWQI